MSLTIGNGGRRFKREAKSIKDHFPDWRRNNLKETRVAILFGSAELMPRD